MLGAQARAAELQAAKSAALRQRAHQEAEEQKIPAQSTPVLLTDFARNPLLTKNKGTKAFRPLTDSDFEGSERQADLDSVSSVPDSFVAATPLEPSMSTNSPQALPTAPRAMRAQSGYYSPSLAMHQDRTKLYQSHNHAIQPQTRGASRYEDPTTMSPSAEGTSHTRIVFGPDDLSPVKQETKFIEMHQQYSSSTLAQHQPKLLTHNAMAFTPQHQYHNTGQLQYQDVHTQLPFDPYMFSRSQVAHCQPDIGISSMSGYHDQSHMERTQSFANDVLNHQTELQRRSRIRSPLKPPRPALENDQPYDRNSKMQSFVAAQQAMARKGKTVLHNPDLYRSSPLAEKSTPHSEASSTLTSPVLHSYLEKSPSKLVEKTNLLVKWMFRKPGEESASCQSHIEENTPKMTYSMINGPARPVKGGNTIPDYEKIDEEWCALRPITINEKSQMLRFMKDVAAESTISDNSTTLTQKTSVVGPFTPEWMGVETLVIWTRQYEMEAIIDEYEKREDVVSSYGAIGKPLQKERLTNVRHGPLRPVANIMAMLYHFADEHRLNPNKDYTTTPIHAIDGNVGGELSRSLFDDYAVASGRF